MHVAEVVVVGAGFYARAYLVVDDGILVYGDFDSYAVALLNRLVSLENRVVKRVGGLMVLGINVALLHTVRSYDAEDLSAVVFLRQVSRNFRFLRLCCHLDRRGRARLFGIGGGRVCASGDKYRGQSEQSGKNNAQCFFHHIIVLFLYYFIL